VFFRLYTLSIQELLAHVSIGLKAHLMLKFGLKQVFGMPVAIKKVAACAVNPLEKSHDD
jgi:hypothetical protein